MPFIEFQNILPRLLVLGPSYLFELMSTWTIIYVQNREHISEHITETNFRGQSFNLNFKGVHFRSQWKISALD